MHQVSYQDAFGMPPSKVHVRNQLGESLRAGPGLAGGNLYLSCRVQQEGRRRIKEAVWDETCCHHSYTMDYQVKRVID